METLAEEVHTPTSGSPQPQSTSGNHSARSRRRLAKQTTAESNKLQTSKETLAVNEEPTEAGVRDSLATEASLPASGTYVPVSTEDRSTVSTSLFHDRPVSSRTYRIQEGKSQVKASGKGIAIDVERDVERSSSTSSQQSAESEEEWQHLVDMTHAPNPSPHDDQGPSFGSTLTAGYLMTDSMFVTKIKTRLELACEVITEGRTSSPTCLQQVIQVINGLLTAKWCSTVYCCVMLRHLTLGMCGGGDLTQRIRIRGGLDFQSVD
eukprot:m.156227 g.156227  ORF g.156227 m.156227 type:complete len:264 (+) comp38688_c0_seq25:1356-2147(+)